MFRRVYASAGLRLPIASANLVTHQDEGIVPLLQKFVNMDGGAYLEQC